MSRAPIMFTAVNGRLSPGDVYADHDDALTEVYDARNARLATFQPEADEGGEQQGDAS